MNAPDTLATLRTHFPVDVTEPDDCCVRYFHCSCGFTGTGHALSCDDWLAHFGAMLDRETS